MKCLGSETPGEDHGKLGKLNMWAGDMHHPIVYLYLPSCLVSYTYVYKIFIFTYVFKNVCIYTYTQHVYFYFGK